MAGQVVQAIIVPENGNLELLKEIFGDDFDKIRTDMAEQDGTSVVYMQAQKSDFVKIGDPIPVGNSGVKVCAGELKNKEAGATETVATLAMPVIAVAEIPANETQPYGFSDFATRIIGELKKSERRLLEEVKSLVAEKKRKEEEIAKENETKSEQTDKTNDTLSDAKSANTEGDSMSTEKEFVTKEDLTAALEPIAAKADAVGEVSAAVKGIQETLQSLVAGKTEAKEGDAVKTETDVAPETAALQEQIAAMKAENEAFKAQLQEQAEKTEALQHAGSGSHTETDELAQKAVDVRNKCAWNSLPQFNA